MSVLLANGPEILHYVQDDNKNRMTIKRPESLPGLFIPVLV
jgi:hypothetical protein